MSFIQDEPSGAMVAILRVWGNACAAQNSMISTGKILVMVLIIILLVNPDFTSKRPLATENPVAPKGALTT